MKITRRHILDIIPIKGKRVICIGKFDGMHKGHEAIFAEVLKIASVHNLIPTVFLFKNNPSGCSKVLYKISERIAALKNIGFKHIHIQTFDERLKNVQADDFLKLLKLKLGLSYIVVGANFTFGNNKSGNFQTIISGKNDLSYGVTSMGEVADKSAKYSSASMREYIQNGNLIECSTISNDLYSIRGIVITGAGLGSSKLGIPTANIIPFANKILPPYGVFFTKTYIGKHSYYSLTNIGVRPTVASGTKIFVETHILDFNKNIYKKHIKIEFLTKLRDEKTFNSLDDLKSAIHDDITNARKVIESIYNAGN